MSSHGVQILVTTLLSTSSAYILLDGFHRPKHHFPVEPLAPHPLVVPPPLLHPLLPPPPYLYRVPPPPASLWSPPALPPPSLNIKGVFPPFIERIVQRIQTFWSVYNPPEILTKPPPYSPPYTTKSPRKKTTTTPSPTTATTSLTTPDNVPTEAPFTPTPNEVSNDGSGVVAGEANTSATSAASEPVTSGVSTLAVYEVTPSSSTPEEPTPEGTTTQGEADIAAPQEPPEDNTSAPLDLAEEDTEDTDFISPERASLISHKQAYLRYLQTGKVPPYLESDRINEMDDATFN